MDGQVVAIDDSYQELGSAMTAQAPNGNTVRMSFNYLAVDGPPLHPYCRCTLRGVAEPAAEPVEPPKPPVEEPAAEPAAEPKPEPVSRPKPKPKPRKTPLEPQEAAARQRLRDAAKRTPKPVPETTNTPDAADLTGGEKAAIVRYNEEMASDINRTLRKPGATFDDLSELGAGARNTARGIDSALEKIPAVQGTVHRYADLPGAGAANKYADTFIVGKPVGFKEYLSSTADLNPVTKWSPGGGAASDQIKFVLHGRSGRRIEPWVKDRFIDEREVLFPRNTKWQVLSKRRDMIKPDFGEKREGGWIVEMIEV
jgi:hypothetical protein